MAFVAEAALIALREGLEALLITGILLGLVTRLGRPDARRHVWAGFWAAVAASLVAGVLIQRYVLDRFEAEGGGEWFELVAALTAVALLTYMVFWMWSHTRELMTTLRGKVAAALTAGSLATVVALTFASVIREGLEVVLFYAALADRASAFDLAWSGLVGLVASAAIVALILRGAWKVDLQRFFGVTGVLLVFVAAGLLVHSVMAATALGFLPPANAIWDTSAAVTDDSAAGRILHALVGYTATPTLLQAVLYFGYVLGVGGAYLWGLGAFHTRAAGDRRIASRRLGAAALAALLVAGAVGAGAANPTSIVVASHSHTADDAHAEGMTAADLPEDFRFGVLLRSHGEPVHYNETTYASFAEFVRNLLVMFDMEELLLADQGTVLVDKSRPFERGFHADAALMDAWTRDHPGPALYVGSPTPEAEETRVPFLDGYYVAPGGPGLGEPDILEMAGLGAWAEWLLMENASPMHFSKLRILDAAEAVLEEKYGDRVVVRKSYHVLPHVGPGESDAEAAAAFVEAGVALVVDAYTSAVGSDVMDTCMMRPHLLHALDEAGYHGRVVHATPSGPEHEYAHGVAGKVRAELAEVPADARVAVFLTHHGARPDSQNPCGSGPDRYHATANATYVAALRAVGEEVSRDGVRYFQVYGQGGSDPARGVWSPLDALEEARAWGATHVVDVPYELTGDGFDNLVAHRGSYGLGHETAPNYDAAHETRLTMGGVSVLITSSGFGVDLRARALVTVVDAALADALDGGAPGDGHDHGAARGGAGAVVADVVHVASRSGVRTASH